MCADSSSGSRYIKPSRTEAPLLKNTIITSLRTLCDGVVGVGQAWCTNCSNWSPMNRCGSWCRRLRVWAATKENVAGPCLPHGADARTHASMGGLGRAGGWIQKPWSDGGASYKISWARTMILDESAAFCRSERPSTTTDDLR